MKIQTAHSIMESMTLSHLTIGPEGKLLPPEGKLLTMIVDGVEVDQGITGERSCLL